MVGVHQQTGLQSGRSWCPGGESQSSRDEPDLSLWRRGPQNAQPTLASVCTVRIVCVARSCLSSTYLAAGTLPVRVNVVVLNTSVPNEAASFTGRSGHTWLFWDKVSCSSSAWNGLKIGRAHV